MSELVGRLEAIQARHKQANAAKVQAERESKQALWSRIKTEAPDLAKWLVQFREAGLSPQVPRVTWPESKQEGRGDEIGPNTYVWVGHEINAVTGIVGSYRGKQLAKKRSYGRKQNRGR